MKYSRFSIFLVLAALIAVPPFAVAQGDDDRLAIETATGQTIVRPVGDYLWKPARDGLVLGAGDRVRVRSGDAQVELPQADLLVMGDGEFEILCSLVGGVLQPWTNDIQLYIGSYELTFRDNASRPGLTAYTLFAEMASSDARVDVLETAKGTRVTVREGAIRIRHRNESGAVPKVLREGETAWFGSRDIRVGPTAHIATIGEALAR
ncbi:MAG: hypothetical protein KJ042_01970 [Deltaproteobacteria bacterium]|nr:hypothetical protein [Deltaproteobacteria bacterium]